MKVNLKRISAGAASAATAATLLMGGAASADGFSSFNRPFFPKNFRNNVRVTNINDVDITNTTRQTAITGDATVFSKFGGKAVTGDATNVNSSSFNVGISNSTF